MTRVAHAQNNAKQTSPYEWFESEVAGCIPSGTLVLGLQHYWLGLRQYPYRTWLLPIAFAQPRSYHEAMDLDAALERVNPDVILVDRYIDDLMTKAAAPGIPITRSTSGSNPSRPAAARRSRASSETARTGPCRCTWCRRRSRLAIPNPKGRSD